MAVVPNPGDRLRSDRTVYTIEEVLYKGDASIACRARDEGGTTVFLKFYKTPSKFKPWFRPYLEYEKELNKRLQTDPELCQKSVYATDLFVGKMECNGSPVGDESVVQVFPFVESGITLGNILNIILDPIFIFVFDIRVLECLIFIFDCILSFFDASFVEI